MCLNVPAFLLLTCLCQFNFWPSQRPYESRGKCFPPLQTPVHLQKPQWPQAWPRRPQWPQTWPGKLQKSTWLAWARPLRCPKNGAGLHPPTGETKVDVLLRGLGRLSCRSLHISRCCRRGQCPVHLHSRSLLWVCWGLPPASTGSSPPEGALWCACLRWAGGSSCPLDDGVWSIHTSHRLPCPKDWTALCPVALCLPDCSMWFTISCPRDVLIHLTFFVGRFPSWPAIPLPVVGPPSK